MTNLQLTSYECIVVGAGLAGLVAARNLQRRGHQVLVIAIATVIRNFTPVQPQMSAPLRAAMPPTAMMAKRRA